MVTNFENESLDYEVIFLISENVCNPDSKKDQFFMDVNHHSEEVLLARLRKGDTKAFELIFKKYWQRLYLIAKAKLVSHDDAEEVIQSIFSTLWEKRKTLLIKDLSHYLMVSVKNRILNHIRENITKERYWSHYRSFLPQHNDVTSEAVAFDDLDHALQDAVNSLPEKSREVFKLSRVEGRSNAEIANMLELSEKAIQYHLTKSLKSLKVILKDYIL
jgi:RNA polymerase sigma-70 factor (family 1)